MTTEEIVQYITMNIVPIVSCVASIAATLVTVIRMFNGLKEDTTDAIKIQSDDIQRTNDKLDVVISQNVELRKQNEALINEISRIKGGKK